MGNKVKIEKDIYVKDKYGVRRHAFIAGDEVDEYFYNTVITTDEVVNPDDLPKPGKPDANKRSVHSTPVEQKVEVLVSEDGAAVERERVSEVEGNARAVAATADVAKDEPTPAGKPKVDAKEEAAVEAEDAEAEPEADSKSKKSKKGK